MVSMRQLLALWSALAAAARTPGRLRIQRGPSEQIPSHWVHPVTTVVVGLLGVTRIERHDGPPTDLLPGDALVIAAGSAHRHVPLRPQAAAIEIGFDYGWCDLVLHGAGTAISATMPRQPAESLVARMLDGETAALPGLLDLLLARPLDEIRQLPLSAQRMRDRIRSHGLTPITAADIARAGGLGQSRAWQVFRTHFGCTPRQALERRRCALAVALLDDGVSVAETARRCGFRDRGTFARAYARVHGETPRARRLARTSR